MSAAQRKSAVKGPTVPYSPALWPITQDIGIAVLFQQVHWLSEEYGNEEGWTFCSVEEFSTQLGPHKSVIGRWLKRLVELGIVERTERKDQFGRFGYRSLPEQLQTLEPRLKLRDGRWNETPPPSHSETPTPLHERDRDSRSTRVRTQDVDVDVRRRRRQRQLPAGRGRGVKER